jgi:hypothetical protein
VTALAVVQDDIDELIDNVLDLLPLVEILCEFPVAFCDAFCGSGIHELFPFS